VPKKGRAQASEDQREYTGLAKAAVFLLAVGPDAAGAVLKHMDRDIVEELSREIASLGAVPIEDRQQIVEEFYSVALARQYASDGGLAYARKAL